MRTFLLIVVTLAVGGGLGYLYAVSRADGSHARQAAPRTGASPAAPAQVQPRGDSDLARALRALPVPRVGLGSGRITGTVRDDDGNGVAGVTVRAYRVFERAASDDSGGPPAAPDLEDAVREFVHDFQRRELTRVEALTDDKGAYALQGLAKAEYALAAYLVDHAVRRAGPNAAHLVRPGATVDWIASAVASLRVDVLLPDGRRPEGALIECERERRTTTLQWSAERPEIRLPPGRYKLSATAQDGPEEFKADAVAYEVAPGKNERTVVFRLRGSPGIRGTIRPPKDLAFGNLRVWALRYAGALPSADQLTTRGKETWVWGGGDGSFAFQDLPPGQYVVGVGARRGVVFATATCEVKSSMTSCDVEVGELDPEDYVVLRVFDPDGKAVTEVDLETGYETTTSSSSGGGAWAVRDDGAFLVFHHDHEIEEGGRYSIRVKSERYGRKKVEYQRGKVRELEIRFAAPAQLAVTVEGFANHPHAASITFGLKGKGLEENAWESTAPDGTGALTLGPVETGEYQLVMYVSQQRHEYIVAERQPVTLRPGDNRISVAIPRLYPLTVRAKAGAQLNLTRTDDEDGGSISLECDAEGRATFPALPAGRYTILTWGAGGGQMEVTLPGPADVEFKPGKLDALLVSVTDAAGNIAKAGFQDGDLIIAIDGSEFENATQLQMLIATAMSKEQVTFTVLRGGRRLDVVAKIEEMLRGEQGGRLTPSHR